MTRISILAIAGIACLLATSVSARPEDNAAKKSEASASKAPTPVDLATAEECEFPFFHREKWWSTCITLSSSTGKAWCKLKKGYYSTGTKNNATAYCDPTKFSAPRASVGGSIHDCLTQEVDGEFYTGCSAKKAEGPFVCKVNIDGKDEYPKCLAFKTQLDTSNESSAKASVAGEVAPSDLQKTSVGTPTLITVCVTVGAVALLAGLFVYRRRQSRQSMSMQSPNKNMPQISMSGPRIEINPHPAAATSTTLSDITFSQHNSSSNSQVLSPTSLEEIMYPVVSTYTPTLGDELEIQPGDKVSILIEYDDGWCQGVNHTRGGLKGVFPRHCVDMTAGVPVDESMRTANTSGASFNA
ncbi:hypothetical protein BDF22DRAFT_743713 [Syncephalis plumigaleata]|nr:hypothetical protein BDF22DRAFT_743713 [Syncephalis plumigaleata]